MRTDLEPSEPEGMNMTPMIDVTFQLIIFFMLVADFAHRDRAELRLPTAHVTISKEDALVLNVRSNGTILIQGRVYFRPPRPSAPEAYDANALAELFGSRRRAAEIRGGEPAYAVLIRADRSASWQWLQLLMTVASQEGGITRLQFAALQDRP